MAIAASVVLLSPSIVIVSPPVTTRIRMYTVHIWYILHISFCSVKESNIYYVHTTSIVMVRRMIATITQIESVVTPSGNSGHVVVPKAWIGKEAIVTLKEQESKGKGKEK
jgi:putative transposon-encoded protein